MITNRIFHKYFLIAVTTLILFIVLGFLFNHFLLRQLARQDFQIMDFSPPTFMARVIDRLNPTDRSKGIEELLSWHGKIKPGLQLVDENGSVIYPIGDHLAFDWATVEKPSDDYAFKILGNPMRPPGPPPKFDFLLGPGGPPPHPPGGFGGPPGNENVLIKMPGTPVQYLVMQPPRMPPPPGMEGNHFPMIAFFSQIISLLLGIAATLAIIYWSVNKNVKMADAVISELQSGNLKARFKVTRSDEFGQAMQRFNKMADEIEKLVEHMRQMESSRNKLMQELAHDLRTPIASLKSLLETLNLRRQGLSETVQTELLMLSSREVDYFERLVEDLLFLGQVSEPKYQSRVEKVDLQELLSEESDRVLARHPKIRVEEKFGPGHHLFQGDSHLLRRLFRNIFENSFSFAESQISITMNRSGDHIHITIDDNGKGFTPESLHSFGEKKFSRVLEKQAEGRVSVGLGSVIIKTITEIYRGKVTASNRIAENGVILGARIEISIPV